METEKINIYQMIRNKNDYSGKHIVSLFIEIVDLDDADIITASSLRMRMIESYKINSREERRKFQRLDNYDKEMIKQAIEDAALCFNELGNRSKIRKLWDNWVKIIKNFLRGHNGDKIWRNDLSETQNKNSRTPF